MDRSSQLFPSYPVSNDGSNNESALPFMTHLFGPDAGSPGCSSNAFGNETLSRLVYDLLYQARKDGYEKGRQEGYKAGQNDCYHHSMEQSMSDFNQEHSSEPTPESGGQSICELPFTTTSSGAACRLVPVSTKGAGPTINDPSLPMSFNENTFDTRQFVLDLSIPSQGHQLEDLAIETCQDLASGCGASMQVDVTAGQADINNSRPAASPKSIEALGSADGTGVLGFAETSGPVEDSNQFQPTKTREAIEEPASELAETSELTGILDLTEERVPSDTSELEIPSNKEDMPETVEIEKPTITDASVSIPTPSGASNLTVISTQAETTEVDETSESREQLISDEAPQPTEPLADTSEQMETSGLTNDSVPIHSSLHLPEAVGAPRSADVLTTPEILEPLRLSNSRAKFVPINISEPVETATSISTQPKTLESATSTNSTNSTKTPGSINSSARAKPSRKARTPKSTRAPKPATIAYFDLTNDPDFPIKLELTEDFLSQVGLAQCNRKKRKVDGADGGVNSKGIKRTRKSKKNCAANFNYIQQSEQCIGPTELPVTLVSLTLLQKETAIKKELKWEDRKKCWSCKGKEIEVAEISCTYDAICSLTVMIMLGWPPMTLELDVDNVLKGSNAEGNAHLKVELDVESALQAPEAKILGIYEGLPVSY